jgi:hypothetical protein
VNFFFESSYYKLMGFAREEVAWQIWFSKAERLNNLQEGARD